MWYYLFDDAHLYRTNLFLVSIRLRTFSFFIHNRVFEFTKGVNLPRFGFNGYPSCHGVNGEGAFISINSGCGNLWWANVNNVPLNTWVHVTHVYYAVQWGAIFVNGMSAPILKDALDASLRRCGC